jgi:hypothetical protein
MSEEIFLNTIQNNCYECAKLDTNLVKACDNKDCETYYHEECLKELVESNNLNCKKCESPIIITETNKCIIGDDSIRNVKIALLFCVTILQGLSCFGFAPLMSQAEFKETMNNDTFFIISLCLCITFTVCIFCGVLLLFAVEGEDVIRKYLEKRDIKLSVMLANISFLIITQVSIILIHCLGYGILTFTFTSYKTIISNTTFITGLIPILVLILITTLILYIFNTCYVKETKYGV